jgi:glutamate/tyrosine decarboxylase-like PLP-dependent enzyme
MATQLPQNGTDSAELLEQMKQLRRDDVDWHGGRVWSLVYHIDDEVGEFLRKAHALYMEVNGLNLSTFPSLRKYETEVVSMAAHLLNGGDTACGTLTSGGTESILMALKTARSWAKATKPQIKFPEVVAPISAHPAFNKAAEYLGLKLVMTPLRNDYRADVQALANAITPNTILVVGSAPSYPQGVVDPIPEIAALAQQHGILCHVDACVGGFMLPFLRKLGKPVPAFDFAVPGVTSMSADLHKYGYAAKGASLILHRTPELRQYQFYVYTGWTGGIYASPAAAGTRPGGSIAAAWGILNHLGESGYLKLAERTWEHTQRLRQGIEAIEGLRLVGDPDMTLLSFTSDQFDIYAVGDEMTIRGWHIDRQQNPPNLHLTVMANHGPVVEPFLHDLRESVKAVKKLNLGNLSRKLSLTITKAMMRILPDDVVSRMAKRQSKKGKDTIPKRSAAIYGMMGELPSQGDLDDIVLGLMNKLYTPVQPANGTRKHSPKRAVRMK